MRPDRNLKREEFGPRILTNCLEEEQEEKKASLLIAGRQALIAAGEGRRQDFYRQGRQGEDAKGAKGKGRA